RTVMMQSLSNSANKTFVNIEKIGHITLPIRFTIGN
ncbi:MAG: hypothetical protein ACI9PU_001673, partial [Ascidiaceihabitans sp.]